MKGNVLIFSKNLKKLRTFNKMKQEDLAVKIGVARSNISYYETQKSEPTLTPLINIANIFNVTINELVTVELTDDIIQEKNQQQDNITKVFSSSEIFSKNLKELRIGKNMYQIELAKEVKTSKSNISFYESGRSEPTLGVLMRICDFFNIKLSELVSKDLKPTEWIKSESDFIKKISYDLESVENKDENFLKFLYELKEYYLNQSKRLEELVQIKIPAKLKEIDNIIEFVKEKRNE
ncbi:helix-turn-helix domain-containing protein [Clostridium botulinum]|uniref:LexA repressor n=2 Tax=Clostridium botulinum TaxID=1491 RepID=B2TSD5_CLOBB|nr:helix-turn-helix domain-containing protein [Clostridium botulinum]ACD14202.1 putative LexA repressor [Clostridium botulinum B str. Eklund 17B (NRP)]AIW54480.1 putative phage LexA repressor DNA binding protein [Clostridium botulinum]AIW54534.1 putative phage LexA repressor DNA binding protein [Clostridium botulinum]AIW54649.1 putative phage LexA repressor DNA binding protein [Clostridium botulinum]AIW54898.1 putative phage LexA repressor DNA binding protein [Clostridium botulinum]